MYSGRALSSTCMQTLVIILSLPGLVFMLTHRYVVVNVGTHVQGLVDMRGLLEQTGSCAQGVIAAVPIMPLPKAKFGFVKCLEGYYSRFCPIPTPNMGAVTHLVNELEV